MKWKYGVVTTLGYEYGDDKVKDMYGLQIWVPKKNAHVLQDIVLNGLHTNERYRLDVDEDVMDFLRNITKR